MTMTQTAPLFQPLVSVITPTTGKKSLNNLRHSLMKQGFNNYIQHIVLWDSCREDNGENHGILCLPPLGKVVNIELEGSYNNKDATGSALRAVGLMAANTEFVTFADDDVMWEDNHLKTMLEAIKDKNWCYCRRKIWAKIAEDQFEYLGEDQFESMGEEAKTPYKMVDNSSMMFRRRFGSSAAPLYRETTSYNDDRLMYEFLKVYAGAPGKTNLATVNQICPDKLVEFFSNNCTKKIN